MGDDDTMPLFVVAIGMVLSGFWYLAFYRNRDWAWKERWFPPVAVATTAFAVIAAFVFRYPVLIVTVVLAVVFLTRDVRNMRFCHRCGRTNFLRGNPRPRLCRECGLDLQTQA